MLRCSDTGREWAGRRVQGAQEVFVLERCVCQGQLPALAQPIQEGLVHAGKGRVVGELDISRRLWYQCTGTSAKELEDRTSC